MNKFESSIEKSTVFYVSKIEKALLYTLKYIIIKTLRKV